MYADKDYILSLQGITKVFAGVKALDNVNLQVEEGEIHALVGENGAGKSTLLKTISGLLHPTKGDVVFLNNSIIKKDSKYIVKSGITQVPEGRHIFPGMTVYENLLMGAYLRKDKDGIQADLESVYKRFPILKERLRLL